MYEAYWGLSVKPFENTPDPRFMFNSREHEEGLSRLLYAVREGKGAAILTGIFGCGKTLLARKLIKELDRDIYKTANVTNPFMTYQELLMHITYLLGARDFPHLKSEVMINVVLERLSEILENNLNDGKKTVLIIDEAHVIKDPQVWEGLRLILNFQTESQFLLTLLLLGQPELKENISSNKQFMQRIAIKCHLESLSQSETADYVKHRLGLAGRTNQVFNEDALNAIFNKSGGIPRRINHICDLALFSGMGRDLKIIDEGVIREVSADLE